VSRLLLWAGPFLATMRGGVFYAQPRRCDGCERAVRIMRRNSLGVLGCTYCVPPFAGTRRDHF
jgi:ribosomal protein L37AE/L43A